MRVEGKAREICRSLLCYIAFLNIHVRILLFYNEGANKNVSLILFILFLPLAFRHKIFIFSELPSKFPIDLLRQMEGSGWRIGGWVEFNLKLFFLKFMNYMFL